MAFNKRTVLIAIVVVGLAVVLVAGIGFRGRRETVASRSAAAFREALRKGEPLGPSAHGGHGGSPVTESEMSEHGMSPPGASGSEKAMPGMSMPGRAASDHAGMQHGTSGMPPMGSAAPGHAGMQHGMAGMQHGTTGMQHGTTGMPPTGTPAAGHAGMQHGATGIQTGIAGMPPADSASGSMSAGTPAALPKAAQASPGQPARTLQADPLDQPAETSVVDATRSLEMAREMGGMAGMEHGATSYRQLDAGRDSATTGPEGESVPPESSGTPKTGAPAPHHHGMQHASPQASPTPVPRPKPPSTERKPSTPESAPTHPPHHHSGGSGDGAGENGGSR